MAMQCEIRDGLNFSEGHASGWSSHQSECTCIGEDSTSNTDHTPIIGPVTPVCRVGSRTLTCVYAKFGLPSVSAGL